MKHTISDDSCRHPGCGCEREPGSDYCSPLCEKARDEETDCLCGHPDCRAEA